MDIFLQSTLWGMVMEKYEMEEKNAFQCFCILSQKYCVHLRPLALLKDICIWMQNFSHCLTKSIAFLKEIQNGTILQKNAKALKYSFSYFYFIIFLYFLCYYIFNLIFFITNILRVNAKFFGFIGIGKVFCGNAKTLQENVNALK